MANYWAKFKQIDGEFFRFDTRIYLNDIIKPSSSDYCIGAVVGKNPGSARPGDKENLGLQKIALNGDKLLPAVRNIILKSFNNNTTKTIPQNGYIQVLNLSYLCDKDKKRAFNKIKETSKSEYCESENTVFNWVWYVWGGSDKQTNAFKERFTKIRANKHYFWDYRNIQNMNRKPEISDFVKHTQGLKHALVIDYISKELL